MAKVLNFIFLVTKTQCVMKERIIFYEIGL